MFLNLSTVFSLCRIVPVYACEFIDLSPQNVLNLDCYDVSDYNSNIIINLSLMSLVLLNIPSSCSARSEKLFTIKTENVGSSLLVVLLLEGIRWNMSSIREN